jgi:hypothetical protein
MMMKAPRISAVMLAVMGVFQAVAAAGTLIPSFIDDRVSEQFIPVWKFLTKPFYNDATDESVVRTLAYLSQAVIGASEALIAIILFGAAVLPSRRVVWANFGLGYASGLFGAFMVTMFAVDDPNLPKWSLHLAVLTWIGVTWLVVAATDRSAFVSYASERTFDCAGWSDRGPRSTRLQHYPTMDGK